MGTARASSIVVVPDLARDAAGVVTWWTLSGDADVKRLREAWAAAGLPQKLEPDWPSPSSALRAAVVEQVQHRRLVRPLGAGVKGYAIVDEQADKKDLSWRVECRAILDAWIRVEPEDHPLRRDLEAAFQRHLDTLGPGPVSGWLVRLAHACQAVSLRDSGGFYFIPREQTALWRAMADALMGASNHVVAEIPALPTDRAVDAILAAVEAEAEQAAAAVEAELAAGNLGAKALQSRSARCERVLEKVGGYEALLGRSLDALRERVEALNAQVTAAALAADAGEK